MRIYEINTWPWLERLGCTLDRVPQSEWDRIESRGCLAVWLMGVWERSPVSRAIATQLFPDYQIVGSPYAVRRYTVDEHLGGDAALAKAREELARRGMRLILDYVPNHVAPDHPWVTAHPEYFVHQDGRIAQGRDPFFPPWTDTVQLNAFEPRLREAAAGELKRIATQCDGVRCDMAMLLLNDVFARTWGLAPPNTEYWTEVRHQDLVFVAEAYWGLEPRLLELGFDFCYDKRLYDRLRHEDAASVRAHLAAPLEHQCHMVRFLENHDEPRAATSFPLPRHRAAAAVLMTTPGAKLFYDGQFEGRRLKLPVQAGHDPHGDEDAAAAAIYARLRGIASAGADWRMADVTGWPDNTTWRNLLAWTSGRRATIVNFSGTRSQGLVRIHWPDQAQWTLVDRMDGATYVRNSAEMSIAGLYVDLPGWGVHLFDAA